jgi:hypothetical protein
MPKQPKAKKAGRPPMPKGEAKAKYLRIRLTPGEHDEVAILAKKESKTISEWVRGRLKAKE